MKIVFCLFLSILILASCSSNKKLASIPSDQLAYSLEKGPCFGKCPVFKLTINGDGSAKYEGERHTEKMGVYTKQLSDKTFKELRNNIAAIDVHAFPDEYRITVPDLPMTKLNLFTDKGMKSIQGKDGLDEGVMKIERMLEDIANSDSWTLVEEKKMVDQVKKDKNIIKTEIIIEPGPGTLLPNWIRKMQKPYGLRLVDKIKSNNDMWLISYDPRKISAEEMIKILKEDKQIKYAEFNKKIKNRGGDQ